jgi:hypothetical protein
MEEINADLAIEESAIEPQIEEAASPSVVPQAKKPRAIIIKATNKDFQEINSFIKSNFPDVQVLYVTTGPAASILRVTKRAPFEVTNSSEGLLYSVE